MLNKNKNVRMLIAAFVLVGSFSLFNLERLHAAPNSDKAQQAQAMTVVNVNKAGAEELQTIRGIGPKLAERIITYRAEQGLFKQVEDLVNVRGISQAKLEKMRSQISI